MRSHGVDPDALAHQLLTVAARARSEAPSWRMGDARPLVSPEGEVLGTVLPGRGIVVNARLRRYGITKALPHVYERGTLDRVRARLRRILHEEQANLAAVGLVAGAAALGWGSPLTLLPVGALSSINDYLNAASAGKRDVSKFSKNTFTTVASTWSSVFRANGWPAAGAFTGALGSSAPSRATTGALNHLWTAPGSDTGYLHELGLNGTASLNGLLLIDLLYECGGISATSTSTQTLGATALTRYTDGVGVVAICVITTALGGTASNLTVTYTNSGGTGSRSSGAVAMLQSGIAERLTPVAMAPQIILQSGDVGIQSVQSVILSASMTAGVFALILYKPLADVMGMPLNSQVSYNMLTGALGGAQLLSKTSGNEAGCLTYLVLANGTSLGQLSGRLTQSRG